MTDPFTAHLAKLGFNAIALPTSVFAPLSLVFEYHGRRGWSNDFGGLISGAQQPVPTVSAPVPYPGLSGKEVRSDDVGGALKVLSGLIGALGGGTLGLSAEFKSGSTITFEYGGVTMTEVGPVALENYLKSGSAPGDNSLLGRYLSDHLFVATRVLRAREFSITVQRTNGQSIGVDLPVIQNAVGANVKVSHSGESNATITFKGEQDVAFAFEAFWIRTDDDELFLQPTKPGHIPTTVEAGIFKSVVPAGFDEAELPVIDFEEVDVPFVSLGSEEIA